MIVSRHEDVGQPDGARRHSGLNPRGKIGRGTGHGNTLIHADSHYAGCQPDPQGQRLSRRGHDERYFGRQRQCRMQGPRRFVLIHRTAPSSACVYCAVQHCQRATVRRIARKIGHRAACRLGSGDMTWSTPR